MFRVISFVIAFLLGASLSPDNSLSLWPEIPSLEIKQTVQYECSLSAASVGKDGKTVPGKCVCRPISRLPHD